MQQAGKSDQPLLPVLIKRGAEADIYLTEWHGKKAVSKIRTPKPYRHRVLDTQIRKQRTLHEAEMMSFAKLAGVAVPFVYFVDIGKAEIIMEYVEGKNVKDALSPVLCNTMGRYTALIHASNIVHGDLATSNFISAPKDEERELFMIDFGLSFYSERLEDRAVDIRLIKQVFSSAHISLYEEALRNFVQGYSSIAGGKATQSILKNVAEIEQRGRYARVQ